MALARRLQSLLFVTLPLVGQGCLVTDAPTYSAPDLCPPSFVHNEADPPVGEHKIFNTKDKSQPLEFTATVPVRSCAIAKKLYSRVFVDNKLTTPAEVNPNGTRERTARFTVPLAGLSSACHKIEFLVTGEFSGTDFRTPTNQGDLDSIVWWIDITDDGTTMHSIDTCPRSPTTE